jgi:hypothetical protein
VAVECLSPDYATGAGNREFRAQLEVLGSLSHFLTRCIPVLLAAWDVGRASDVVHLVSAVSVPSRRGPGLRAEIRTRIFYRSLG